MAMFRLPFATIEKYFVIFFVVVVGNHSSNRLFLPYLRYQFALFLIVSLPIYILSISLLFSVFWFLFQNKWIYLSIHSLFGGTLSRFLPSLFHVCIHTKKKNVSFGPRCHNTYFSDFHKTCKLSFHENIYLCRCQFICGCVTALRAHSRCSILFIFLFFCFSVEYIWDVHM